MAHYYPSHSEGNNIPRQRLQPATEEKSRVVHALPTPSLRHPAPETSGGSRLYPTLDSSGYLPPQPLSVISPIHRSFNNSNTPTSQDNSGQQAISQNTSYSSVTSDKPLSIQELAEKAWIEWDPNADFKYYLRHAERLRREGKECTSRGDLETAFVRNAQSATLILEKMPEHRQYYAMLNAMQRHNLALNGQEILDELSAIKPELVARYDNWMSNLSLNSTEREDRINTRTVGALHDRNNTQLYDLPGAPKMSITPPLGPKATWHRGWGNDNNRTTEAAPTTESPANHSISEHLDRSQTGSAESSFSDKFSSAKTEDLTGFVKRDSEYPANGGGYADVYTGTLMRRTRNIKVAIKVIRSHTYTASNQWKIDKRLRREIRLWSCLRHPNVVPLLGTTTGFGLYLAMVCPWMKDGNLSHYLSIKAHELSLRKRLQILADVIEGLAYLHSQSVIHGDLTTGNILMDEGRAHLSDFGLSNVIIEVRNNSFMSSTVSGSPRWTAPELLHLGLAVPDVTKHCDIYSFGSVMLQTITGRIPYENISLDVQVLMEVMRGRTPTRPLEPLLSDELWDLIFSCWSKDPMVRPEIGQVRELLHVIRYDFSEEELSANIVDSDKSPGQDDDDEM